MTPLGNKLVGEITLRGITLWEEILRWGFDESSAGDSTDKLCWGIWWTPLGIGESWLLSGKVNSWLLQGKARIFWLLNVRNPGNAVGESGAWVVCQSTGDSCLEGIFTGEYSNILWGPENESLHSAWGLIVGSFSSAGDCKNLLIAAGIDVE